MLFRAFAPPSPTRRSQRPPRGSRWQPACSWHGVSGKHYADYLTAVKMSDMTRPFQQRHLLAHTGGIVDQDYITRSGDSSYAIGQRIVVRESAVRNLLAILQELSDGMSKDCPRSCN